ncbi:MAG: tyrosine phenol-lyase [Spirochaetes bacterium GWD1_61_31]|nr:MAG: tyrosine phenol-lyase [Spirochaetes bacterium GWB1_60_80]OHD32491.1 MAG: tyrosine phenol-lyase [Spirochaetes bacterium GWC1_61_12]OHD35305.1 MAG: tyrosine phenol-lyase [Spirochaetes bacterium GWD1_61_31]OHD43725.1 MAG: tyrosine phenol-lyase [Spirochaetes bacterium GWE1_60_18]OHD60210.1 MAG: tyrosine phenol-lyase [Spirochaetes bacterium GWF1_60_12]HAP42558.1 tyrosine phenol-lyase [Spirochaetaceae bacterium]
MDLPWAEPYRIKTIEPIYRPSRVEREAWIKAAQYNLFNLRSEQVYIDLLTDSGTGAMSSAQWSEIMLGDESYAGASSYYKLKDAIERILGFPFFLPTHQGRAAENVLFSAMIGVGDAGQGKVVPGNSHFDTTKGHIEFRHAKAIDCTIDEAFDTELDHPFKGNIDLAKLEAVYKKYPRQAIPLCVLTITCNSSGGQPVSMANIKAVAALSRQYHIPLFFDSARFAENAYFIKTRETGYSDKTIKQIVREMFSYADGVTMSSKKDGIVNIGGFIAFRDQELFRQCCTFNIMFEGFITYGGMAGRDMGALSVGLDEATEFDYLEARVGQVAYLGRKLTDSGIVVQRPYGGHAIFVDARKFLPQVPKEQFIAQTLGIELYREGGVRGVEIGTLLADRDPETHQERYPALELLRLAIPRRTYTNSHMDYIAAALANVKERAGGIRKGFVIKWEAPIMRHFTVELSPAP